MNLLGETEFIRNYRICWVRQNLLGATGFARSYWIFLYNLNQFYPSMFWNMYSYFYLCCRYLRFKITTIYLLLLYCTSRLTVSNFRNSCSKHYLFCHARIHYKIWQYYKEIAFEIRLRKHVFKIKSMKMC